VSAGAASVAAGAASVAAGAVSVVVASSVLCSPPHDAKTIVPAAKRSVNNLFMVMGLYLKINNGQMYSEYKTSDCRKLKSLKHGLLITFTLGLLTNI
jgi:hypothetical protein